MIINKIKDIIQQDKRIAAVYVGDVLRNNEANKRFPCVNIDLDGATIDGYDVKTNFMFHVIDQTADDRSNETQIQIDCIMLLKEIFSNLINNGISIELPATCTTFSHRFADQCAGAYCEIIINDNNCIEL